MSHAATFSGQNTLSVLPRPAAQRRPKHNGLANPFAFSLCRWEQADFAPWSGALHTRKPSAMQSMKRLSPVPLPCLSGHTLRGFSCARRHGVALLRLTTPSRNNRVLGAPGYSPPFGSWFLPKGHPPRKRNLALGSMAHYHPSTQRPRAGDPVSRSGFANG